MYGIGVININNDFSTKSCLIDRWPTFLFKGNIDILPSITKLVNYSLAEGLVPKGFKNAVFIPLIKKSSLPVDNLKKES